MGKVKKLIVTIDIDNDFTSVPLEDPHALKWEGITLGLPLALEEFNRCAISLGTNMAITLFCRADWQIENLMGDVAWVFKKTQQVLSQYTYSHLRIDLQWHPHLYENSNGTWQLPLSLNAIGPQIKDVHEKLTLEGFEVTCSRIGECFFNNDVMDALTELSISSDSTAFPGRNLGHTDWSLSPREPYHPSSEDFRLKGNSSLKEVPFSMIPVSAPYEDGERLKYFNLIFATKYTKKGIADTLGDTIVTILHPYEILTIGRADTHQLFGQLSSISENIKLIYNLHAVESILLKEF